MDNIQGLAEKRGNKSSQCITSLAAFLSILEFLEVWCCGWTLVTLLSPDEFPNLWKINGTTVGAAQPFHDIPLREQYMMCVVAYLAFFLLFVVASFLLLWGNWYNKVTPFLMYQATVVLSILLCIAVTIYFLTNDHECAFLFITNPEDERSIPYLILLLYFSRYFAVGWILNIAFVSCSSQRRNRLEEEKDMQGEVDKAFKNVFDSVHAKNDRGRYYEEPDDALYDRPPSVPEYVQRIPRIRLSQAGGPVYADGQHSNGYINKGFEHDGRASPEGRHTRPTDSQQRDLRYADDKVIYMKRHAMRDPEDYAIVDLRPKHRRSQSDGPYGEERTQQHERQSYHEDGQHLNAAYQHDSDRLPDPPIELGGLLRSDDNVRNSRPLSLRESFAYGPGPRGYDVPSPHSRPKSIVGEAQSLVRRLSARYEDNVSLRTGPAPTGGVPAIGPASIRRVPPRSIPHY